MEDGYEGEKGEGKALSTISLSVSISLMHSYGCTVDICRDGTSEISRDSHMIRIQNASKLGEKA